MTMNARERFLASMHFEPCDHPPYWEWAYWIQALQRWYGEGLPRVYGLPPGASPADSIMSRATLATVGACRSMLA